MFQSALPDPGHRDFGYVTAILTVCGVDKLLMRKAGPEYFVGIHIEVASAISVRKGHDIGHAVKGKVLSPVVAVRDVLVRFEPAPEQLGADRAAGNPEIGSAVFLIKNFYPLTPT